MVSYAEGDSKRYSVESYHVAENRALSQLGEIESHSLYENEVNQLGNFKETLFKENITYAAKEAVNRIRGTPFAGHKFQNYLAPPDHQWVFGKDTEEKTRHILKSDAFDHISQNNFVIKPSGQIWNILCEIYHLQKDQTITAATVYQESVNCTCTRVD